VSLKHLFGSFYDSGAGDSLHGLILPFLIFPVLLGSVFSQAMLSSGDSFSVAEPTDPLLNESPFASGNSF